MKKFWNYFILAGILIYCTDKFINVNKSDGYLSPMIEKSENPISNHKEAFIQSNKVSTTNDLVDSSMQNIVSDNFNLMAPESDTIDDYFADVEEFLTESNNTEQFKGEITPVSFDIFDIEVTLWHSMPSAKSVLENYALTSSLSEEFFIEFDEYSLEALEVGQRFTLPKLGKSRKQVIVKKLEDLENGAKNWELMDNQGEPAGSLTKVQGGVIGVFFMPKSTYHLFTQNGIGWITDETTLINANEQAFTKLK